MAWAQSCTEKFLQVAVSSLSGMWYWLVCLSLILAIPSGQFTLLLWTSVSCWQE